MFGFLKNALSVKDIRRRILYTLMMLAIYRLGSHIPVPGVDASAIQELSKTGILGMLNMFGGGALQRYSIFAMGVSPYITSSIIVQLLSMDLIPSFTEWAKQGEVGRRKLNQWTTYIAIILGYVQSLGLSYSFNNLSGFGLIKNASPSTYAFIALILTAGTMLLVWMGEQITRNGIGNGLSLLIFAGIIAEVPKEIYAMLKGLINSPSEELKKNIWIAVGILVFFIVMTIIVVAMEQAQRKIPIHHSKKATSSKILAHLPLKINSAGVIPVIFATSFMTTPRTVMEFFKKGEPGKVFQFFLNLFDIQHPYGTVFYIVLLVAFTYFYALLQIDPEKVAENLQKQSAYIPSVRPGNETDVYLTKTINRLSFVGALYLTVVAILPILSGYIWDVPMNFALSGTSLLIVVGVAIDTMHNIEGRMVTRRYKGFLYL